MDFQGLWRGCWQALGPSREETCSFAPHWGVYFQSPEGQKVNSGWLGISSLPHNLLEGIDLLRHSVCCRLADYEGFHGRNHSPPTRLAEGLGPRPGADVDVAWELSIDCKSVQTSLTASRAAMKAIDSEGARVL